MWDLKVGGAKDGAPFRQYISLHEAFIHYYSRTIFTLSLVHAIFEFVPSS